MNIGKPVRLVAINLVILVGAFLAILFVVSLAQDLWRVTGKAWLDEGDRRFESPAYEDAQLARRILEDQQDTDYVYQPFVAWRQKPIDRPTLHVGDDGNRRHKVGTTNRPDARSLGMFGGSTMWGTGVDDDNTIAAIFDQITDGFVVTNYGERGHTSRQNLAELVNLINTRRMPQVVVFYSGYNDVWAHCNYAVTESLNGHMEERKIRSAVEERRADGHIYRNFLLPMMKLLPGGGGGNRYACDNDATRAEAVAEMMVETWAMARDLVEARGGEFHLFLQPNAYVGKPNVSYIDFGGRRRGRDEQFDAVYPLVQRKLAQRGAKWARDLSGAFDGDKPIYIDDAHVAPQGNRIIAEAMREAIAAGGR